MRHPLLPETAAFYDRRYRQGYMDEWPAEKRRRVFDLVRELGLPDGGNAIDFGCGNGVFTHVLKEALPPDWDVSGTDISTVAIEEARRRYPACTFFITGAPAFHEKKYDFLLTHHVLEHVPDLEAALSEMDDLLKPETVMLHILPCGNEGSFERAICLLRRNGIDGDHGNRWFFEDEGHLRRLNTEQLRVLCEEKGFVLAKEYYANQDHGAIDWITRLGPRFVQMLTDPSEAVDERARRALRRIRRKVFAFWCLRYPAAFFEGRLRRSRRTGVDWFLMLLDLPFYILTKPMDLIVKGIAEKEWRERRTERSGSEMFLVFKR